MVPPPRTPEGCRIYAVGDIHGHADLLDRMLGIIGKDLDRYPPAGRVITVFLGDYVDRGPASRDVIDRLIGLRERGEDVVLLKGNHEVLFEGFLKSENDDDDNYLCLNGGMATLSSYGVKSAGGGRAALDAMRHLALAAVPDEHKRFLASLSLSARFGDYFFVHAGVRPGVPLEEQSPDDLLWIRGEFLRHSGSFGAVVVHGHTPVDAPVRLPNRIGIDTGAFFTGRLTSAVLEGESVRFLSTRGD
jgi:serine/threonine protein phosphatase 1